MLGIKYAYLMIQKIDENSFEFFLIRKIKKRKIDYRKKKDNTILE
jgi:hypothetical protein